MAPVLDRHGQEARIDREGGRREYPCRLRARTVLRQRPGDIEWRAREPEATRGEFVPQHVLVDDLRRRRCLDVIVWIDVATHIPSGRLAIAPALQAASEFDDARRAAVEAGRRRGERLDRGKQGAQCSVQRVERSKIGARALRLGYIRQLEKSTSS